MENEFITFNTEIWGYDFTCSKCGRVCSVEGEAPVNARATVIQQGWQFIEEGDKITPICQNCA